jgi:thioredoxin 1
MSSTLGGAARARTRIKRRGFGGIMAGNAVLEVTDGNFEQEVLKSEQVVMIDFWAVWCQPCKALAPIVDEVAEIYNGKLKVMKMDVDKNTSTPNRYGVRGIPTLLVFKDGVVKEQIVGRVPKETIQKAVDKHLSA